jgi:hypothetical protein
MKRPVPGLSSLLSVVDLETDEEHADDSSAHQMMKLHELFNQLPRSDISISVTLQYENARMHGRTVSPGMLYRVEDKFYVRATGTHNLYRAFANGVFHAYPEDITPIKDRVNGTYNIPNCTLEIMRNKGKYD